MRRKWIYSSAALLGIIALLAAVSSAASGGREPERPEPLPGGLAGRLQSILAHQEDGHRVLLPPGGRNLERIVEAAHALRLLGRLDAAHLTQTVEELESSWDPSLGAYTTDDDRSAYGDGEEGGQSYRYDLLALNVRVAEFLDRDELPAAQDLPSPDLQPLIDGLGDELGTSARILKARAARLSGGRNGSAPAGSCRQIAEHVGAARIDAAAELSLTLPSARDCETAVRPLLDDISALEGRIVSRIAEERSYTFDDVMDLDRLRVLAEAGGRDEASAESVRAAGILLRSLDDDAREYGPFPETWAVVVLARLLDGEEGPALEHLTRRLEALIDFRGSLATSATADWYTRTLMAHLMVLSGALTAEEAADLFGHPSADDSEAGAPDWAYAFVGLRGEATADLSLPRDVLAAADDADAAGLLIRALYASDSGSCSDAPDLESFRAVSPRSDIGDLPPDQRLGSVLALALSASCSGSPGEVLPELADEIELPDAPPDPAVRGSTYAYLLEAETACLAHGAVTLGEDVEARLDSHLQAISDGPVTQSFDFLDVYAALRLLSMHRTGSCDGAWWDGLNAL